MRTLVILLTGLLISPLLLWADPGANDLQLSSSAFEDNAPIPSKYTCDGTDVNPPLTFKNIPAETKSMALTISDPDAPSGRWSHWVIYNISPNTAAIDENTNPGTEGINDFGKYSYGGPCPPAGKLHHYIFHAYALDNILSIKGATINDVEKAVGGHIIGESRLVGTYQKKG